MDVREKLVELINQVQETGANVLFNGFGETYDWVDNEKVADHLVARNVTVQEWISVKDERKPNHGDIALCYMTFGEYRLLQWDDRSKLWVGDYMGVGVEDAAYWQMPQPPKGE